MKSIYLSTIKDITFMCFSLLQFTISYAQTDSTVLQKPSGIYPVGTVTYEWEDKTRNFSYSSYRKDKRVIPVQFWYPSVKDNNAKKAPYSALSKDYAHAASNSYLYAAFSNKIEKSPLIIISPGRGTERYGYTTIAEELASNGYVVVAIDMPEIGYVIYGNGYIVKPSSTFRPPRGMMGGPYEKVDEFFEEPTRIGVQDIEFVISNIHMLNKGDITNRFKNKIDIKNIGIFGHSLGGRIAGAYAAKNKNVKAYISMEGIPPRDVRYEGLIKTPTAMLSSSGTYHFAKDNYDALILNRNSLVYMIVLNKFGHNSVTDFPLITPSYFNYAIEPKTGLRISRSIIRNFFNEHLLNRGDFDQTLSKYNEVIHNTYNKP